MKKNFTLLKTMLLALFVLVGSVGVWAGDVYTRITSLDDLSSGEYLIVGHGTTNSGIMLNTATTAPIINYTAVQDPATTISDGYTVDNVFTVTVTGNYLTIYNADAGYVSWGNTGTGSGNHAGFYNGEGAPTDSEKWIFTVEEGLWSLSNLATPARFLSWNNTSPRFAAYGNKNQVQLSLYKKGGTAVERVAEPVFNPAAGAYTEPVSVTITTATSGATIYYTTNGENPTNESAKYTGAIQVSETTTIKAIALKSGMDDSVTAEATYTIITGGGDLIEDFEGDTGLTTSYADGSFTNSSTGITWNYGHSRNEGFDTKEDYSIEGKGLLLRRASDSYLEATFPNGVGNFSFQYRKAFTGGNNNRQLELIVNGEQVAVTDKFGSTGEDNTVHDFSFDVNVAGEVTIKIKSVGESSSNAQVTLDNIAWTEKEGTATPKAATPTFSPTGGTYNEAQSVTISTTTEGATIYYTTDGSNPTTGSAKYTAPITINKTTTVKAIAVKSGLDNSSVATATYTINTITEVSNIAALHAAEVGGVYKLTGEALVTFLAPQNRNAKFIQDATGAVMVDDPEGKITSTYNVGDGMKGLVGKTGLYGGLLQFVPESDPGAPSSTGNTVTAKVVDLADLADYESQLVEVKNVTIDASGVFERGKDYGLNGGDNPILRTQYDLDYIGQAIPSGAQNMIGVAIRYNEKIQFVPRSAADIVNASGIPSVATPVITPPTGSYFENQEVTITTATEGATIYYTTNGFAPTTRSKKYTEPFLVEENTTVMAFATKAGMTDSGVATSEISIVILSGTDGDGSKENPFSVADVKTLGSTTGANAKFWVKAFVVGGVTDLKFPEDLQLEGPFVSKTNLVVADATTETDTEKMLPIQLPPNPVRDALNLVDNPSVYHGELLLYGTLERYFGKDGMKNITDYQILSTGSGLDNIRIMNLYTTPGMIHFSAAAGEVIELYNLAGQKIDNRIASEGLNSLPVHTQGVVILKLGNKVEKVIVK